MTNIGKRIKAAREGIDRVKFYGIEEAVKLVKSRAKTKFDETVDIAMNLGVDPKHADQMVRGVCNLPNGSGRTVRVAVFAKGGSVEFRVEKSGIVHAGVGKASFTEKALVENIRAFVDAVNKSRPTGAKGTYIKKVSIKSTMGPGLKVDQGTILGAQTAV